MSCVEGSEWCAWPSGTFGPRASFPGPSCGERSPGAQERTRCGAGCPSLIWPHCCSYAHVAVTPDGVTGPGRRRWHPGCPLLCVGVVLAFSTKDMGEKTSRVFRPGVGAGFMLHEEEKLHSFPIWAGPECHCCVVPSQGGVAFLNVGGPMGTWCREG